MVPITSLTLAVVLTFEMVQIGDVIPPFTLKTVEGRDFNSEKELSGKVGVVTFWRPDQVYSERLLRDLQELSTGELAKDLCVVAICFGEHDAHDSTNSPFLRATNDASALCLTCHTGKA